MIRVQYDAIVVLGKALNVHSESLDEQLGETNRARIITALASWHKCMWDGEFPYLVMSGGGLAALNGSDMVEATKMKEFAVQQGADPKPIITETDSLDTWTNALHTREILERLQISKLQIVTSEWHEPRASTIFDHVYGDDFLLHGLGAPETPTARDLAGERSGIAVMNQVIQNSQRGDITSIKQSLYEAMGIYTGSGLAEAA